MIDASAGSSSIFTFFIYLILIFGLAILSQRYLQSRRFVNEYFLGSRSLGTWTLAMTYAATSASGGSLTGFPALIYEYGWILALWISGYMVVPIICLGLFGKRINQVARKTGAITLPDLLRDRFRSPALGVLIAVTLALFITVYMVAQFKAGGLIVQVLLQDHPLFQSISATMPDLWASSDYCLALFLFSGCVILYTTFGGFRAVVWTDVLQGFVMLAGVLLLLFFTLQKSGGLESVTRDLAATQISVAAEGNNNSQYNLVSGPGGDRSSPGGFLPIGLAISFFIFWPITGAGQPGTLVRLMAFKSTQVYRRAIWMVSIYYSLIYLSLLIIFVCARTILPSLDEPDQVMPRMAVAVVPPVLTGILLAAPFAAIMSTVDSFLLMISSSLVRDIYQRTVNPKASERTIRLASYATTAIIGTVVTIAALNPPQFLQDIVVFASTGLACCFLAPVTLSLYWKRSTTTGMIVAVLGGMITTVVLYAVNWYYTGGIGPYNLLGIHPALWGLLISFLGGFIGSLLSAPPPESLVRFFFSVPVTPVQSIKANPDA